MRRLEIFGWFTQAELCKAIMSAPSGTIFPVYKLGRVPLLPTEIAGEKMLTKLTVRKDSVVRAKE